MCLSVGLLMWFRKCVQSFGHDEARGMQFHAQQHKNLQKNYEITQNYKNNQI